MIFTELFMQTVNQHFLSLQGLIKISHFYSFLLTVLRLILKLSCHEPLHEIGAIQHSN